MWQTLAKARQFFWNVSTPFVRRRLALSILLVLGLAVAAGFSPYFLKLCVDALADYGHMASVEAVLGVVLAYVLIQGSGKALIAARDLVYGLAAQRLSRALNQSLFEHVIQLPLEFHLRRKTGAVVETIEQGVRGYTLVIQNTIFTLLPSLVEFSLIAVLLIHLGRSHYLAILALSATGYFLVFRRGTASVIEPATSASSAQINARAALTEALLNYETIKSFNAEQTLRAHYDQLLSRTETSWRSFYLRLAGNGAMIGLIFICSLGANLTLAAREVMAGSMTSGDFVLIAFYVLRTSMPLEGVGYALRDAMQGLAFLRPLAVLLDTPREPAPLTSKRPERIGGELRFERVCFAYESGMPVLQDISFCVAPNSVVAIVGESGAGKSTLGRLLLAFMQPTGGQILLDGVPISTMAPPDLRAAIAVVPQDTPLFHTSIRHNIALGRTGCTQEEIEQAGKEAHLHDFVTRLPEQYETIVGERGLRLSGGERQRVAIARALVKRAPIVLCDEPTSSLDPDTERRVLPELLSMARRQTTVCITHRLSIARHANTILVLKSGRIVEQGTHTALLAQSGVYARLWQQAIPDAGPIPHPVRTHA